MKIDNNTRNLIKQELKNDIGARDITTHALISRDMRTTAVILAKQNGVIAGMDIAMAVFKELDTDIKFKVFVKDGDNVKYGKKIAEIKGSARAILSAERTALNFLSHLSGVATLTKRFVDKVKPYKAKILDTRKTMPGLRGLEKYAVKCAGGVNHRIGLWDAVLIKDNHILLKGQGSRGKRQGVFLEKIVKGAREKMPRNTPIEIEVTNLKEFKDALRGMPDIILLDNMNISQIKQAVQITLAPVLLEVSGGVSLLNVRQIAASGVDRISIGALTHSAKAFNLSLEIVLSEHG